MAIQGVSVDSDQERIINGAGQIVDTIDFWAVRWTEAVEGYVDTDYRRDFMDEAEARAFAAELEQQ